MKPLSGTEVEPEVGRTALNFMLEMNEADGGGRAASGTKISNTERRCRVTVFEFTFMKMHGNINKADPRTAL